MAAEHLVMTAADQLAFKLELMQKYEHACGTDAVLYLQKAPAL
jgi:hypothetical protein